MKKKLAAAGVMVVSVLAVIVIFSTPSQTEKPTQIYHARLADPKLYQNGIFQDALEAKKGIYQFRFVPNGDSPQTLTISLKGEDFSFSEDFILEGTPRQTAISTYYTWRYLGKDTIQISQDQNLEITINPHGNTLGPVSVFLVELKNQTQPQN